MTGSREPDWDPTSANVLRDQLAACDDMRRRCPVAWSEALGWSLFRHDDILHVLEDPETFSNAVSKHHSVPNGMDPPEHAAYRRAIESCFRPERMQRFAPVCRRIAGAILDSLLPTATFDCIDEFALPFVVRCQCSFLGWPQSLVRPIQAWARRRDLAMRAGDGAALAAIAHEFRSYVDELLQARRRAGVRQRDDVIAGLMQTRINGLPLTDEDIASIMRNWTVGEVGSIAAAVGILAEHLVANNALQRRLRAYPSRLPAAIDEILRTCGPLVMNRRVATRDVDLRGRQIKAGERIALMWIAANRDEQVFDKPAEVRLDRDPRLNLLYGAGIHACPGAPLARLELRVAMEELLRRSTRIRAAGRPRACRAVFPGNGWATLPLELQ